jgi:hypothetical protein
MSDDTKNNTRKRKHPTAHTEYNVAGSGRDLIAGSTPVFASMFRVYLPILSVTQTIFFSNGSTAPWGPRPPHFSRLHDHTF